MANNLTVEAPAFDRITKGDMRATSDAIQLLWFVLNQLSSQESSDIQTVKKKAVWTVQTDAPVTQQDSYDTHGCGVVLFTSSTPFSLTGIRNGAGLLILANLGSATVTVKQESASSAASERIDMAASADKAVATNKFMMFQYLNNRWREISLA